MSQSQNIVSGRQKITLLSHHNLYLNVNNHNGLFAFEPQPVESTQFTVVNSINPDSNEPIRYGSLISLLSEDNLYVVAEWDGNAHANRPAIGEWERWKLVNPDDLFSSEPLRDGDKIALYAPFHDAYMVAELNGTVNADRNTVGAWETWTVDMLEDEETSESRYAPDTQLPDGVPGASAWNDAGKLIMDLANQYRIEPAVILAILYIESGGTAFRDGRMVIRFENHIFYKFMDAAGRAEEFKQYFRGTRWNTLHEYFWNNAWKATHTGNQDSEWEAFELARFIGNDMAHQSISMGAPQIMGFNYRAAGYASPVEMFEAFSEEAAQQYLGMFNFLVARRLVEAMQTKNFFDVAQSYNGSGQAERYADLMQNAYIRIRPELANIGV